MIVGVILRYFKTYQGRNYIPLTDSDHFCGLVGNNGIGKSSVLEALDSCFNDKAWNFNTATKKSGLNFTSPEIVPLFLIKKNNIDKQYSWLARLLDETARNISIDNLSSQPQIDFHKHLQSIFKNTNNDMESYYLLPIGVSYDGDVSLSFFNNRKLVESFYIERVCQSNNYHVSPPPIPTKSRLDEELQEFKGLWGYIKDKLDYIYIPREIDPESFTRLETTEIQILMGESLEKILSQRVTTQQIKEINKSLNEFLDEISQELDGYSYRTVTDRQQNLRRSDVNNLIIQAFFSIRKLHKEKGANWLDINSLSSGEKQKVIINIAYKLLINHRASGDNLIIGIDEPESSLHISACYDQFSTLYEMSRECMQVIFSTHWYGFLPTVESGSATFITRNTEGHKFDQVNLANYREQIKQLKGSSKGVMPFDIRLKSLNDFVQSIISSIISDDPYNWLICEGSSEKIYLSKYFEDLVVDHKLRIVPVGGAGEIKRLYKHLSISYEDFKSEINGKIFLLSDTDEQLVNYEVFDMKKLECKRMVSDISAKTTHLINIDSNPVSPATEVEDALNGKAFFETLLDFKDNYHQHLSFLDNYSVADVEEVCSRCAIDLKASESQKIKNFFKEPGIKYEFSKAYCEVINDSYQEPSWIIEIREYFES